MMFRVGQKVVAIEDKCGRCGGVREPGKGDIGTVTNVYVDINGDAMIELAEFPAPEDPDFYPGWYARYFRPVVSRKTSIEIFQRMLKPSEVDA